MTRISFLVPTYNRADYLGETLAAIVAQATSDDEILVIDDGSTDATAAAVQAFAPRVRYLRQDNAGKSAALNRALAQTDGEYVWICDDDDILRPAVVEPMLDLLATSDAGWAFARYTRFYDGPDGTRHDMGTGYWPDLSQGALPRHILEDGFVMQNAALVRRSVYAAVGPFCETLPRSIDYEMFVRLAVASPCVAMDGIVFDQRKHVGDRGPAWARHSAGQMDNVWRQHDLAIFHHAYARLPLSFFSAFFTGPDRLRARAGLLQRAVIMARHDCIDLALADFKAATATDPDLPFDAEELRICGRALTGKNAVAGFADDTLAQGLRRLGNGSARGGQLVEAMLSGARWRLRRGSLSQRKRALSQAITSAGLFGTLRSVVSRWPGGGAVQELRTLPKSAYLSGDVLPVLGQA